MEYLDRHGDDRRHIANRIAELEEMLRTLRGNKRRIGPAPSIVRLPGASSAIAEMASMRGPPSARKS
jgi:hypothetical protein